MTRHVSLHSGSSSYCTFTAKRSLRFIATKLQGVNGFASCNYTQNITAEAIDSLKYLKYLVPVFLYKHNLSRFHECDFRLP